MAAEVEAKLKDLEAASQVVDSEWPSISSVACPVALSVLRAAPLGAVARADVASSPGVAHHQLVDAVLVHLLHARVTILRKQRCGSCPVLLEVKLVLTVCGWLCRYRGPD